MCLRPKHIVIDSSRMNPNKVMFYRSLVHHFAPEDIRKDIEPRITKGFDVPCGQCIECLRARQSDLAARVALAAKDCNSMFFVTLTYRETDIPLSARRALINVQTGEVELDGLPIQLCRLSRTQKPLFHESVVDYFRDKIIKMPCKPQARVLFIKHEKMTREWSHYYYITPSLHRRDVRMWLKRCRVEYERRYKKKMSNFRYVLAGEFGPKTCRPHYHLIFLGIEKFELQFMLSKWGFGFSQMKKIPAFNKDGTSGYVLAAKYVSKYIIKGKFDADSVLKGYTEKPRVCLSRYIGTVIPEELCNYLRCYDMFGKYDLDTLVVDNGNRFAPQLSKFQLMQLYNEFRKRAVLKLGLKSWLPLPKVVLKRVFGIDQYFYSLTHHCYEKSCRQSVVQMAFGSFVESDFLSDFVSELRQSGFSEKEIDKEIMSFSFSKKACDEISEQAKEKNLLGFYSCSKF